MDKRFGARVDAGGPAMLNVADTYLRGSIRNLSARGAFFSVSGATPDIGVEGTLTCDGGEGILVKVAWISGDGCGLTLMGPARNSLC